MVRTGGVAFLAVAAAGCDAFSTRPAGEERSGGTDRGSRHGSSARAKNPSQAPDLERKVRSGELPPLSQRLPAEPLVIPPVESVGRYGGTWHSWLQGLGATYIFTDEVGYDFLVRWDPGWTRVIPNLAKSWDVSGDGRQYTFHLRPGTRWSDGRSFTADDLVFAFEDVLKDTELYPVPPTPLVVDGEMARMEKLDSDTVRFVFGKPSSLFLEWLSTPDTPPLLKPRHYLERFHKTYNKNIDGLVKDEGFAKWTDLFLAKDDPWRNPDLPVLNAWRVVKPLGKSGDRTLFERNPYYWKTDPHGSQLPYLDQVSYQILQDLNVASLKTTNGDIDFNHPTFTGGVCTSANKPVLARNRDSGGYHFIEGRLETMNQMVVYFNLCDKDPVLRKVFRNRDFRIGLSYAIKRQEITEAVFQRQGEPWQAAPRRESEFFHEKLAKQYTEYDPDRANRHLDAAGLAGRDSAGLRLRPDGERLSFDMEVVTEEPEEIDALELIRGYWREVGVEMRVKAEDRTLFYDRKSANLHQAGVWTGDGGWGDVRLQPQWYFPAFGEANWAIPWATWYLTGGKDGEEPPAPAKRQMALYDRLTSTVDKSAQRDLFMQILDVSQEQFWLLGTVMSPGTYGTVKNDFHNVPGRIPGAWEYPSPGPTRPEQYWVEA